MNYGRVFYCFATTSINDAKFGLSLSFHLNRARSVCFFTLNAPFPFSEYYPVEGKYSRS